MGMAAVGAMIIAGAILIVMAWRRRRVSPYKSQFKAGRDRIFAAAVGDQEAHQSSDRSGLGDTWNYA